MKFKFRKFASLLASNQDVQMLFDPGEVEYVCSEIRNYPRDLVPGVRARLIAPLKLVIALYREGTTEPIVHLHPSAIDLLECAENYCEDSLSDCHDWPNELEKKWMKFIALTSAHRLWKDVPANMAQIKKAANTPKQKKLNRMTDAIHVAMRPSKREGRRFKEFMTMWQREEIDGLKLTEVQALQKYHVNDDHSKDAPSPYTWGTLRKMYSQAEKST
jgi:hypothetical protein